MSIDCLCAGILFADYGCEPIARMPAAGELVPTNRLRLTLGGCASNAGLDMAKLGFRVGVSGCVGDDIFGEFVIGRLQEGGVNTSGIHRLPDTGTASSLVLNVQGEDRRFISTAGASGRFAVSHIPPEWVTAAKVFYIGGYLMMPELETDEMVELFRTARAAGVKTVLDVVLFEQRPFWEILDRILPETDVFLPNDDEARLLTGLDDPFDQANRFRDAGAKTVVITQGEAGSILVTEGRRLRSGTYPTEFIGGTGSGDAFDAGFIAGLIEGADDAGCLRWGSALGASCVRSIGATESVFTRTEAEAFMAEHELMVEEV